MLVVLAEHGLVAVAQPQRGGAFPLVGESAGLGELVGQGRLGWRAACRRRCRSRRAGGGHRSAAASRLRRRRGGGWRPARWCRPSRTRPRRPGRQRAMRQSRSSPTGAPSARRCWVASQRVMLRACRPSPARTSVAIWLDASPTTRRCCPSQRRGVLPGLGEHTDHEGLPGAGWTDQRLHAGAGGEDAAHGGGLVGAELDPGVAQPLDEPPRCGRVERRQRRRARRLAASSAFGVDVLRGRVQPRARARRRRSGRSPGAARRAALARRGGRRPAAPRAAAPRW